MKSVTVLGCGPVGLATVVLLKRAGHEVIAIDPNQKLISKCRLSEFDKVGELSSELKVQFEDHYHRDFLSETLFFCIGTPYENGELCLDSTFKALDQIKGAESLDRVKHLVFRSTFSPGTCEEVLTSYIQKVWETSVDISYLPEFLREKFIKEDLENPPLSVVAHNSTSAKKRFDDLNLRFKSVDSIKTLELLKLSCNAFHALKVSFANEVGRLAKSLHIPDQELMDLFCEDNKLNISKAYLRPGSPFGGACLDKDLMALEALSKSKKVDIPVMKAIRESNELNKKLNV